MPHVEDTMTPVQMAALIDTAFLNRHSLTYLDMAMSTFRANGRNVDAEIVALMGCLYAGDEIELLMRLRASWKLGEARHPKTVLRPEMRSWEQG